MKCSSICNVFKSKRIKKNKKISSYFSYYNIFIIFLFQFIINFNSILILNSSVFILIITCPPHEPLKNIWEWWMNIIKMKNDKLLFIILKFLFIKFKYLKNLYIFKLNKSQRNYSEKYKNIYIINQTNIISEIQIF